jgi:putative effector of murein hydrolase
MVVMVPIIRRIRRWDSAMVIGHIPITVTGLIIPIVIGLVIILEEDIIGAVTVASITGMAALGVTATTGKIDNMETLAEAIIGVAIGAAGAGEVLAAEAAAVRTEGLDDISVSLWLCLPEN